MRKYASSDEERIRVQTQVREWTRAGLLEPAQGRALDERLRTDLRRTNDMVRAALALFTALMVAASVALVFITLDIGSGSPTAITMTLAAAVCLALAEYLVGALRFYRYGVEETLAVAAVLLLSLAVHEIVPARYDTTVDRRFIAALLVGTGGGFAVYRRFGYVYAVIGALACAAALPFEFRLAEIASRLTAAAVLGVVFVFARMRRLAYRDDFPGDEYGMLQAVAWVFMYFMLNLRVPDVIGWPGVPQATVVRWFYWSTYAVTWLMAAIGLWLSIQEKDRTFLAVNLVMALATLATNKPYLHRPRQTWDPLLLGVLLMAGAVVVRRWLSRGPSGQRNGFTAARILETDRDAITIVGTASAAWQPQPHAQAQPPPAQPSPGFDGGRSGGAGGGASF